MLSEEFNFLSLGKRFEYKFTQCCVRIRIEFILTIYKNTFFKVYFEFFII